MSMSPSNPASLLISIHDVSPLTLSECEEAVALLAELGIGASALTVLVIPRHEGGPPIDAHPPTIGFLRRLEEDGARLVMHGLTHRMTGRAWSPVGFFRAHLFARGQGEFHGSDAEDANRRLDEGAAILRRAGLERAARSFIPPAWLLSPAGREVVAARGFDFYELFRGIIHNGNRYAQRVIGWGSLSVVEAVATSIYADLQSASSNVDVRVAIHPADMRLLRQKRAIRRAVARLHSRMRPQNYTTYLTSQRRYLAASNDQGHSGRPSGR
jgi:predicted deacetylase